MKLLILGSKEYPLGTGDDELKSGGIEIYTQNLVKHLEKKVGIIIITRKFKGSKAHEKKGNAEIYRVPWIRGFYLRNPSFNFFAFLKALKLDYDLILAQGPVASFFASIISLIKRKKFIARPAGIAYLQPQYNKAAKNLIFFLEKIAYKKASIIVFLSEAEKEQFKKKLGFLPKKHVIIPTGVDIADFDEEEVKKVKQEFGIESEVVITFVGRLIAVKGVDVLIKALKEVKNNFKAIIVGDGIEREKLENLVKAGNLESKIIFAGWRSDVARILAASDIFVLPSYAEGLPIALLEAFAAGKACVVSNIALPVEHEKNALVFEAGNAKALAEAIERLIKNADLRKKLGENARKEAVEKYSWKKAVEKYEKILRELVNA